MTTPAVAGQAEEEAEDADMPELLTQEDGNVDSDNNDDGGDVAADVGDAPATVEAATPAEALLLVDAANGFNNLSRYGMLWTVRHRCPKMSRFTYNCYRHEITLISTSPLGCLQMSVISWR